MSAAPRQQRPRVHEISPAMQSALPGGGGRQALPARNFAQENRRSLREMQQRRRLEKAAEEEPAPEPFKLAEFKGVPSKVAATLRAPTASRPETPSKEFLRRGSGENRATEARARAIRSKYSADTAEDRHARRNSLPAKSPIPREKAELAPRSGTDFVTHNKLSAPEAGAAAAARRPPPATPPELPREDFGQVPRYLLARKEEWAAEEAARRAAAPDPDCPPGMRAMPEEERLETLRLLDDSEREAQRQISRLPLAVQTPSMQRWRDELEARMREIESAKAIFSRPKVYVAEKKGEA